MIYLSGKITDTNSLKEKANLIKFHMTAKKLREQGLEIYNPIENEPPDRNWEEYLAYDLLQMTRLPLKGIYLMSNWKESRGARLEHEMAKLLGLEIIKE